MDPYLKALATPIVRAMLPYPDPRRRRRVRRAARHLVRSDPWPKDADTTGPDAAQLALLRALNLQKQTRRAALVRLPDATVNLARSSLEVCLLGMYCLHKDDAVERLQDANLKAAIDAFGYLLDLGLLPQDVFGESVTGLGAKPRKMPTVKELAEVADQKVRGSGAMSLYKRFYGPTSTFFVHANASSLLRHVKPDNTLTDKPTFPWTFRSAVRVADASVGLLAAALAEHAGTPDSAFTEYAEAHIARAFTPLAAMLGKGMRRTLKWSLLPALIREIRTLRRYIGSGRAASDAPEVREARIRAGFEAYSGLMLQMLEIDPASPEARAFRPVLDHLVSRLVAGAAPVVQDPADPDAAQDNPTEAPADAG